MDIYGIYLCDVLSLGSVDMFGRGITYSYWLGGHRDITREAPAGDGSGFSHGFRGQGFGNVCWAKDRGLGEVANECKAI